jgi:hypothetical protein
MCTQVCLGAELLVALGAREKSADEVVSLLMVIEVGNVGEGARTDVTNVTGLGVGSSYVLS